MRRNHWQPILEGALGQRALAAVREIVIALPDPESDELQDPSLSDGAAGLAALYAYLARADLDTDEKAALFLERAMQALASTPLHTSFYGGFTGIGWALAHLQEQFLEAEDDPCAEIDEALITYLKRKPWQDDYDL